MSLSEQFRSEIDEGSGRIGFVNNLRCNSYVLVQQGELECPRIFAADNPLGEKVLRAVRPSARPVDHVECDLCAHAEFCESRKRLAGGPDVDCEQRLVHCLYSITGSYITTANDFFSER